MGDTPDNNNGGQTNNSGVLDRIFGGFGFGDIFSMLFWGAILCGIFWVFLQNKDVQEFVRGMLPEDWKIKFDGLLNRVGIPTGPIDLAAMPADTAASLFKGQLSDPVVAVVHDNWTAISGEAIAANGGQGKVQAGDLLKLFTSDKFFYGMMANQAPIVVKMLKASNTNGKPDPAMMGPILGAFAAIVKDGRINTLLDAKHFDSTASILEAACPIPFLPGHLGSFIQAIGLNGDHTMTPAMQTFLNSAMAAASTPEQAGALVHKTFMTFIVQSQQTPEAMGKALAELVQGVDVIKLPADQQGTFALLKSEKNAAAAVGLIRTLGVDKVEAVLNEAKAFKADDVAASVAMITKMAKEEPDTLAALRAWAAASDRDTLPDNLKQAATLLKDPRLMDNAVPMLQTMPALPKLFAYITGTGNESLPDRLYTSLFLKDDQLGISGAETRKELLENDNLDHLGNLIRTLLPQATDPTAKKGIAFLTVQGTRDGKPFYPNLDAIIKFADSVTKSPLSNKVTHALYMMVLNDPTEFKKLTPQETAAYFGDPKNARAYTDLLKNLDTSTLDPNLKLLLNFANGLNKSPASNKVTHALYMMSQGEIAEFEALKPDEIVAYFKDEGNTRAFTTMLRGLDTSKLGNFKPVADVLKKDWIVGNDGFLEVVRNSEAVRLMQHAMDPNALGISVVTDEIYQGLFNPAVGQNADYLRALEKVAEPLLNKGVQHTPGDQTPGGNQGSLPSWPMFGFMPPL